MVSAQSPCPRSKCFTARCWLSDLPPARVCSFTFYHYPQEHWLHLRTSNPLESVFSGVWLRTNAAKRMRRRDAALYLVFKLVERLSRNWRGLNGGANLMTLVLEGCVFKDGLLRPRLEPERTATAA